MKDLRTVTNLLEDHVTMMEFKNYALGYINITIQAIKSWLKHFDVDIRRKIRVSDPHQTPTLQNERIPNSEELAEIYARTSVRVSVTMSLIAKA